MDVVMSYLPLIMDVLCVLFFCWAVKSGYGGGIKYALDSFGTVLGVIISAWVAKIAGPFTTPIVNVIAEFISKAGVDKSTIVTVFGIVALFFIFGLVFVVLASIWRPLSGAIESAAKKMNNISVDKVIGAVIEGALAVIFIVFIGIVLWKWIGVISGSQIADTMIYSRLLSVF